MQTPAGNLLMTARDVRNPGRLHQERPLPPPFDIGGKMGREFRLPGILGSSRSLVGQFIFEPDKTEILYLPH